MKTQFDSTVRKVGNFHWPLLFQNMLGSSLWNALTNPPPPHPGSARMGEGTRDWKSELSYSQRSGQPPAGSQLSEAQNQLSVIKQGVWILSWSNCN